MKNHHHPADESMAGRIPGGLWAMPGFVRLQRSLRRKRGLLLAQLDGETDATSIEAIRTQLKVINQRIEMPPTGVEL